MKNEWALRKQFVDIGKRIWERNYVAANDGNITVRLNDKEILTTPTGVSKGFMTTEDMVVVDMNGKVVGGNKKPSSEVFMHLQVYKDRPDVNSVCHAHPPYATGFAVAGLPLDQCVLPEVIIALGNIPIVEYGTPGTEEFYKPVVKLLPDYDAFLLANHGALTVGADILNAYHLQGHHLYRNNSELYPRIHHTVHLTSHHLVNMLAQPTTEMIQKRMSWWFLYQEPAVFGYNSTTWL